MSQLLQALVIMFCLSCFALVMLSVLILWLKPHKRKIYRHQVQPPRVNQAAIDAGQGVWNPSLSDGDDSTMGDSIYGQVRACEQNKAYYRWLSETVAKERAEASKNVVARAYGRIDQDIWGAKHARPEHWAHDEDDK